MIRERDSVVLTTDLAEHGLQHGDIGTVVMIHQGGAGYEVEFMSWREKPWQWFPCWPRKFGRLAPKKLRTLERWKPRSARRIATKPGVPGRHYGAESAEQARRLNVGRAKPQADGEN